MHEHQVQRLLVPSRLVNDAPWPEPPFGVARVRWVTMLLKAAYRSAGRTPINIRAQSATGWCLHPRFTDHLEVRQWIQPPYMTDRQITVLELIAKDDLFTDEIAKRLHVSERTVKRDKHAALQTLIRLAWGEPDYVLPPAPR